MGVRYEVELCVHTGMCVVLYALHCMCSAHMAVAMSCMFM